MNQELRNSGRESRAVLHDKELTEEIIHAAIRVHKELGPGFLESIYEEALSIELTCQEIPFERQKEVHIVYRDKPIGTHRLDLLVANRVVVELKAISALERIHFSIVRSYMKAIHVDSALIINFASMPLTIKSVGREFPEFLSS